VTELPLLQPRTVALAPERAQLVRRARLLAWGGNAWHVLEFAIAAGAGIAASSIALVGFGFDSLIEASAGFVILWRFAAARAHSERAERRAQQALAAVTAPTMPLLARAKQRVGRRLNSSATVSEGAQNMICAYLSIALLVGLGANAFFGWWWADPAAALVIAGVAAREGVESWRGETCDCC
jgi:divalent metal cation (Fe/Co/Zn/Cd) transporter